MYVNYPKYSIRDILIDNNNWERYKLFHKGELREEQIKEIDAMLLCNDPKKGFWLYHCNDCNEDFIRHLSCNSRVCPRCGRRHLKKWVKKTVETSRFVFAQSPYFSSWVSKSNLDGFKNY